MKAFRSIALLFALAALPALAEDPFRYEVREGLNLNEFLRDGQVSAHVLLRSGKNPRFLAVFPAGDSGDGLWFEPVPGDPQWVLDQAPRSTISTDGAGRPIYGFTAEASLKTLSLVPKQAVLSSVRYLRDYQGGAPIPAELLVKPNRQGNMLTWSRDRLDGAVSYRLTVEVEDGAISPDGQKILAGADGQIRLKFGAWSGEIPLTPLAGPALLNQDAAADPAARDALTFLSYREKFLAGSWRFDTYFGRDTLMSMRLLLPALAPEAAEDGLESVLTRLDEAGEVAHEEGIGEFAVEEHLKKDGKKSDAPVNDYTMIDANYMLAPVVAAYLLDTAEGRSRAADFLTKDGNAAALLRNLAYVMKSTAAFAEQPAWDHLVRFKPGKLVGQWRDSQEGNGRGVYAYDVNAVYVPAALEAIARLLDSHLLDPYLNPAERAQFAKARHGAEVWRAHAPALFDMSVPRSAAQKAVDRYASSLGIPAVPVKDKVIRFHALSIDEHGRKVPVIHSDENAALLFANPAPAALDQALDAMMRPFPLGLMTDAGLVVANPVFADPAVQARFSRNAYHGTVVWSWQQALLAAGLDRQLKRGDLPAAAHARLQAAQKELWRAIDANKSFSNSELWTWKPEQGRIVATAFGANAGDADEANAAQLWSTVYLAVHHPN
jgi:hypothetical protein